MPVESISELQAIGLRYSCNRPTRGDERTPVAPTVLNVHWGAGGQR
jgi:hypothetical protein